MVDINLDVKYYSRAIYTALDFLGDVGGLLDALKYIGVGFLWIIQGNSLIQFLISGVLKTDSVDKSTNLINDGGLIKSTKRVIKQREKFKSARFPSPLCSYIM